jgi:hypothetical protein
MNPFFRQYALRGCWLPSQVWKFFILLGDFSNTEQAGSGPGNQFLPREYDSKRCSVQVGISIAIVQSKLS